MQQRVDTDGDGEVSLLEMQSKALVPIVADSLSSFRESKRQWIQVRLTAGGLAGRPSCPIGVRNRRRVRRAWWPDAH